MNIDTAIEFSGLRAATSPLPPAHPQGQPLINGSLSQEADSLSLSQSAQPPKQGPVEFMELMNDVRETTHALLLSLRSGDYPFNTDKLIAHKSAVEVLLSH
jgi:hypothetical protein